MYTLAKWLYLLALIVWVGEVAFFSFVVAPTIFRTLPPSEAGRAVGAIFPTYYRLGYVCGAVLLATSALLISGASSRLWWSVNVCVVALMLAATLYAGTVIQPRATTLRPQIHEVTAPQSVKDEFGRLHRLAVTLNGAVLICGLMVSFLTATTLRP